MKFWKPIILTTALFIAFTSIVLYSSCEKDPCTDITCKNGGSCANGVCKCPTGYEDPTCSTPSIARFVGVYAGYTTCNNGAEVIDTVFIVPISVKKITNVNILQKSTIYDLLTGTVSVNESTYTLLIPDKVIPNYQKKYNVTLQGDSKLILDTYEQNYLTPGSTVINHCTFTGFKANIPIPNPLP
jgi:hypothetical protein